MSTRCRTGKQNEDGSVTSIYCHFDGYLDGVGETLVKHYKTEKDVDALLALGNISSLGEDYDQELAEMDWVKRDKGEWSTKWSDRVAGYTIPYKDRGEENVEARKSASLGEYVSLAHDSWAEYIYLFTKNIYGVWEWQYQDTYFKSVAEALEEEK